MAQESQPHTTGVQSLTPSPAPVVVGTSSEKKCPQSRPQLVGIQDRDVAAEDVRCAEMMRTKCQIGSDDEAPSPASSGSVLSTPANQPTLFSQQQSLGAFPIPDVSLMDAALMDAALSMNDDMMNEAMTVAMTGGMCDRSIRYDASWVSDNDAEEEYEDKENNCSMYRDNLDYYESIAEGGEFCFIYPSPAFSEDEMRLEVA